MPNCKSIGCDKNTHPEFDFCPSCLEANAHHQPGDAPQSMAQKYPKYYREVGDLTEVDVYAVHMLFNVQDASGCIHHASKKLLLSGVRTGGKSAYDDIKEARDTLSRWLELHPRR